jgi:hypothetical protein
LTLHPEAVETNILIAGVDVDRFWAGPTLVAKLAARA